MTTPPNRIGGVRGPNGTTLDDLNTQLTALVTFTFEQNARISQTNANLIAISSTLATMLERLTLLSGTAPPDDFYWRNEGLPGYLVSVMGSKFVTESRGYNTIAQSQQETISLLLDVLYLFRGFDANGNPYFDEAQREQEAPLMYQLWRILNATLQPGETSQTTFFDMMQSIDTNVGAIRTCTCDGQEPPNGVNPAPAGLCQLDVPIVTNIRVEEWVLLNPGATTVRQWGAAWPLSQIPAAVDVEGTPGSPIQWIGFAGASGDVEVCFSWDFTGDTWTGTGAIRNGSPGNFAFGSSANIPGFTIPVGSHFTTVSTQQVRNLIIETDSDTPPSLNAFVTFGTPLA